ncbi:hypothetical protein HYS48_01450 [Candidatus Woesearchaeota archaeon]|nr:hypothetical protein [Candidatus Woesearchaeota archaeon]
MEELYHTMEYATQNTVALVAAGVATAVLLSSALYGLYYAMRVKPIEKPQQEQKMPDPTLEAKIREDLEAVAYSEFLWQVYG